MAEFPEPNDPGQPRGETLPTRGLLGDGDVSIVPRLVQEGEDEYHLQGADASADPEHILPAVRATNNKIADHWSPEWRGNVQQRPQANLAGPLVEEEHVSDESDGYGLARGDEEPGQRPHDVEGPEVWRGGSADTEGEPQQVGPEQGRCTSDDVRHGNPDQAA